jgi:hypothetical protein
MASLSERVRAEVSKGMLPQDQGLEWTGWGLLAVMYALGEQHAQFSARAVTLTPDPFRTGDGNGDEVQGRYEMGKLVIDAVARDLIGS